ncbi:DHA1 family bicyclomycin/chloramphenicol resistance-like MFS transporter [Lipingzhangella halophila]|uniref:DHA1 family bicyclomycin/chloramphenicol resistance-like MFS transporter n=1 Tax=Lipingzhangella halophila TaxID=1783352 RepID=A0A7W7W2C9_9ACTN|nr:multidrug effflux MFS transporter [Lipingzhangella halophila]MBB4931636.1 DHA1 family bicyclomycin/chloramphenicol resistance-like MFS transporter [Lipingzhangella halophila]
MGETENQVWPRSRRSVAFLVLVLGMLTATGPLATDLYLPAFPEIAADLGAAEAQIQLTLTAMMVGLALGQLIIGPLSDGLGRRTPMLVGVAVFTIASFLCVLVPSAGVFVALRFVQGVAGAAGAVISRAVVRDLFSGDDAARFFSRLVLVIGVAPMLGPIVGGQLLLVGPWQLCFVVLGAVSALSFVVVFFWLPETLPGEQRQAMRVSGLLVTVWRLVRDARFVGPALTLGLTFAMMFTYISAFSFVSQDEFGASAQAYSVMFAINTVGLICGTQVNGFLIGRMETSRRLAGGLCLALLAVVVLLSLAVSGAASLVSLTATLFVMMFGVGFVMPNATTLALSSQVPAVAGTASALMGSMQFAMGGGLASLAGLTASGDATLMSMTSVMVGLGVLAVLVFLVLGRRAARFG